MSTDDLMQDLTTAAPIADADVAAADLGTAERALLAEIVGNGASARSPRRWALRWRFTPVRAAIGLSSAVAVAAVAVLVIGSNGRGGSPAFAAEAVQVAEANPRLLVTEPGWEVRTATAFSPENGTVIFEDDDGHRLEMNWTDASQYPVLLRDRRHGDLLPSFDLEVLGRPAPTVHQGAALEVADYETLIPPTGSTFVYVRGSTADRAQYIQVVESLESTDVNTWLSAMPDSVVKPNESAATVDEMLDGIPLPPGFEVDTILDAVEVGSRYRLAARVTSYVTCGWLDSWVAAERTGDQEAANRAVQAMATSREWPILREIAGQGGWSQSVWEYADKLASGDVQRQVYDQEMNCIEFR